MLFLIFHWRIVEFHDPFLFMLNSTFYFWTIKSNENDGITAKDSATNW